MKTIPTSTKVITIVILTIAILIGLTDTKVWDYEKTQLVEYNQAYNEKYKVTDTLEVLYENVNKNNPIKFRTFEKVVKGHNLVGTADGGSRLSFIHIDSECSKCKKYWLNLLRERQPSKNNRDSTISSSTIILP